jgi:signal transduction histidine kinase
VDDREFEPTLTPMRLPNSARLRFEYTAPMMAGAAKVRFRYRLDGFDADWIDAGARRQAFYTNLSPGSYRFRVAAHVNGLWTDSDEVVDVSIAPRFYQTYWFLFGCTVAVVLITGILLQLRLRNARKRFALVLAERVRIARELHDTLLQGLIGVGLQCKVIADKVKSEPDSAISRLEWMQGTVELYIRDARESIRGLRSSILKEDDLPTVLRRFGESVVAGTPARFEVVVTGKPRVFPADVTEQLVRVAQEALTNAVRHGDPRCVHLEIEYQRDAVEIHVHDDGCGFDPADPAVAPHDHWGLASMHERAVQIQGKLTVTSRRGQGTAVDLVVALPE